MSEKICSHRDLEVYRMSMTAAMDVFELSGMFPKEEMYSLTDQIRRSSRSVCANLAEAWRKRRYQAAFVSKLSDVEAEAAETQVCLEFATRCGYLNRDRAGALYSAYESIQRMVVTMINDPASWIIGER